MSKSAAPTKLRMPGFSRYYINSDGQVCSDATDRVLSTETVKWGNKGPYYRLIADDGTRKVYYTSEAAEALKLSRKKAKAPGKSAPKSIATAPAKCPEDKVPASKARKLKPDQIREIRSKAAAGKISPADMAVTYGVHPGTIAKIIAKKIYPNLV